MPVFSNAKYQLIYIPVGIKLGRFATIQEAVPTTWIEAVGDIGLSGPSAFISPEPNHISPFGLGE